MLKRRRILVVGNWKMNPATLARAEKLFVDVEKTIKNKTLRVDMAIAPPLLYVGALSELSGPQKIEFVAQDVSLYESGAHTGEVSAAMLRSHGIKCSMVGHSERRAAGESDESINKKLHALTAVKSIALLCVGETERDGNGNYFGVVEDQLRAAFLNVKKDEAKRVIVAYEPVWAIGTGENARPEDVEEMRLFINKVLTDLYDRATAEAVRVLYGGSVTPDNAAELLEHGAIDGFLVGGASLEAKKFVEIVKISDHYAKLA